MSSTTSEITNQKNSTDPYPSDLTVSFEFFPPKSEKMAETLWASITQLAPLRPDFVSVTYGAGGSTRARTHATVERITRETKLKTAAHLTCVDASRSEIDEIIDNYEALGVSSIVALRGDSPDGAGQPYRPHPDGYINAEDLTAALAKRGGFDISVGAYPEGHPDSPSQQADLDNLKRKLDAGADRAITQFFFDNNDFLRFRDRAEKAGITAPIRPGILPIYSFKQVKNFAGACGARVPDWVAKRFEGLDDDPETTQLVATAFAAEQVTHLLENGVRDVHFYTLNKAPLIYAICRSLGIRPTETQAAA